MPRKSVHSEPTESSESSRDTGSPPPDGYVTRAMAAERLNISVRHFKRLEQESPIPGTVTDGEGPTARKLYPENEIDDLLVEGADEELRGAISALVKQAAQAATEVHKSAQLAINAGVAALQGTDARTLSLIEELDRMRKHCGTLEKNALAFWELMRSMQDAHVAEMRAAAIRERERILEGVRHDGVGRALEMALPGIIHRFAPSKMTEKSILAQTIQALPDAVKEHVMPIILGNVPPELAASLHSLMQESLQDEAKRQEEKETKAAATAAAVAKETAPPDQKSNGAAK